MACACQTKKSKYTVYYPNGTVYKTYSTRIEADAAKARIGGTIKIS